MHLKITEGFSFGELQCHAVKLILSPQVLLGLEVGTRKQGRFRADPVQQKTMNGLAIW
jgi:hypothetical protein